MPHPLKPFLMKVLRFLMAVYALGASFGLGFAYMVLPIGQEDSKVRRHPWVTYAIMALCFAVFTGQKITEPSDADVRRCEEKRGKVFSYIWDHPYLQIPPSVSALLPDKIKELLQSRRDQYRRSYRRPRQSTIEAEQSELDRIAAEWRSLELQDWRERFGYRPADHGLWTVITALFIHGDGWHIFGNLIFFFVVGPFIEDVFGRPAFAALYMGSGVAGTVMSALCRPDSSFVLSFGASGAISGVMGAFLIRLASRRIRMLCLPLPGLPVIGYRFMVPAFIVFPLYFVKNIFGAYQGVPGIGWWAHIGGYAFGFAFAGAMKWLRLEERFVNPAIENEISFTQHPALVRAIEMRASGRLQAARRAVDRALAAQPDNVDAWKESYEIALACEEHDRAAESALRAARLYADLEEHRLAGLLIEDALERIGQGLPTKFYLQAGGCMEKCQEYPLALLLYELLRNRHPADPAVPRALLRSGRIQKLLGEPDGSRALIEAALAHPAATEELRSDARDLLARSPVPGA